MKYAIPICNDKLFNHYSKAPQFLLVDDVTKHEQTIDLTPTIKAKTCGKKTQMLSLFTAHNVGAVIIKNIGEAMLSTLFDQGIKVFRLNRGADIHALDFSQLVPVEDLSYAKPSVNKRNKVHTCCKGKQTGSSFKWEPKESRLDAKTLRNLRSIHKIHL
ncbi:MULTISPECIES: NifB/NifX family molybdenum-iron cluster-binding protein [Vibrio]|uniref:Dinitrogenase iron-molybdenum cofactor biosynthesis domain-containing protein n=1 Tax=Vibrio diazotrophicus TaxID=685 RepID=A0A2J8I3V6_VIBDI|nr:MULTISPECIES: NifB/NifX family molybdenum-iron cluster-binding protein [Vibrio]MCF7360497.1 hypothetical protein [Vibrio sp. A1-b2]MCZ4371269.1 hypothetical protein [Vibrio diazotrophicus]PNI05198.1 hypothetical protein C1N32_07360 [Vibrio diazotrophicus]